MLLTVKQTEVIGLLSKGNPDGSPMDMNQLCERLSYKPSKEALVFTIRFLIKRELVEKLGTALRCGKNRRLVGVTVLGQHYANAGLPPTRAVIVEPESIV
jgi:hypothetical protein